MGVSVGAGVALSVGKIVAASFDVAGFINVAISTRDTSRIRSASVKMMV
jgi:hypothetical protein